MADPESALLSGLLSFAADDNAGVGVGLVPLLLPRPVPSTEVDREHGQLNIDDWDDCMRATGDPEVGDTAKQNQNQEATSPTSKSRIRTRPRTTTQTQITTLNLIQITTPLLFNSLKRVLIPNQVVWVDKTRGIILKICGVEEGEAELQRLSLLSRMTTGLRERGGRGGKGRTGGRGGKGKGKRVNVEINIERIVLGKGTVLMPGLVDVHVHLFLHPYTESPWTTQLTTEPLAERVIRATVHARRTLMSGFTCVRDLGTEGALDADLALRSSMAGRTPLIPGPRYYCATRAIVASGAYGPKNPLYPDKEGVEGIVGAVSADGVDNCVREVRRQIGMGADWIKIYADYSPLQQTPLSPISPSLAGRTLPTFTREELKAMIDASHRWGVKIAAHANSKGVVRELVELGVDSVEHGSGIVVVGGGGGKEKEKEKNGGEDGDGNGKGDEVLRELAKKGGKTVWVPTLAAYYTNSLGGTKRGKEMWEGCVRTFRSAISLVLDREKEFESNKKMDNIAIGGDTGVFAHGTNALEMVLMRRLGAEWERVLAWATVGGWRCVRGREWEGREGRERVRRAEERGRGVWGDVVGYEEDDDVDVEEKEQEEDEEEKEQEIEIDLERGTPFGAIRTGWAADLVAVKGRVDGTPEEFERAFMRGGVDLVIKGGVVYKRDGREVVN